MGCVVCAVILGFFGGTILEFGISVLYPRYTNFPRLSIGGGTLLALLWTVTLLSYWLLRDRMDEERIRLPFFMILIPATIQPVCFAFYNFLRVVLFVWYDSELDGAIYVMTPIV